MKSESKEKLLAQLNEYLDLLEKPRQEYEGLPTCPFIKKERLKNKLMLDVFDHHSENFIDNIHVLANSDYTDAVFAQNIDDSLSTQDSKTYQNFLNKLLKKTFKQYKVIIINPADNFAVNGYNPRSFAPCFLIVVTDKKKLSRAHKQMLSTKYFTNFGDDYLKYLHVKRTDLI